MAFLGFAALFLFSAFTLEHHLPPYLFAATIWLLFPVMIFYNQAFSEWEYAEIPFKGMAVACLVRCAVWVLLLPLWLRLLTPEMPN